MKPLVLSTSQWNKVLEEIKKRERPSTYLSRSKMKEVLGFTPRNYEEWAVDKEPREEPSWLGDQEGYGWYKNKHLERTVRLDFYDEAKRTMFVLKYSEFFTRDNETENW